MSASPCIYWFRRDLRVADNTALEIATQQGNVVPVYFASDWKGSHSWTGPKRQQFLCASLSSLSKNIEALGGRLVIRRGDPVAGLRQLIKETGASAIFYNKDPDPHGKQVEQQVQHLCRELGIGCHACDDVALHRPDEVFTQAGQPYRVYTPFSRNWLTLDKPKPVRKPKSIHTPAGITSLPLPRNEDWGLPTVCGDLIEAGERAARDRLKHAIQEKVFAYDQLRNYPAADGTSRISQDLRFGLISIRTVYAELEKAREMVAGKNQSGLDTWLKELAWREFYFAILEHYPNVLFEEFNADWRGLPWEGRTEHWTAWTQGRTGFPIVDAGIRELLATGFMHNRVRMIVAMFLTKDLHIDWRLGESFFMQHLLDGEIASNNGGWQWSAGTGADAAPYFRIQNPWTQSERYDSEGIYIKKWVPELAKVHPSRFVAPPKDGRPIAPDYPLPCVDHKLERDRTLLMFKQHRGLGGA